MQRLLRICQEIEQTVADIYRHWETVFSDQESLSRLWGQMADDELDHVRQIQLAQRVANEQVFGEQKISINLLEEALAKAKQLLKEVRERDVSAEKALKTAIKIEEYFSKAHLSNALEVTDKSLMTMFNSLARADDQHVESLRNYYDSVFGDK
ncbi:MAG: hypothetical protein C0623_14265 [Desulfuromonas sp.]|nr:MAG: hypothetical protein C0623_14265 [Desulfuromonas sp.]